MTVRPRPRIYTASKIATAGLWRSLREKWPEIEFVSRWLDMTEEEDEATRHDRMLHWLIDFEDIRRCDFLLLFGQPGEVPRGSFVEAGAALALGKPVFVIDNEGFNYGTWIHHPLVRVVKRLEDARMEISGC